MSYGPTQLLKAWPGLCCRAILSRPQLALCLLAEVAYEHDEDLRSHLPLLFQAVLTSMDSREPLVYQHAQVCPTGLCMALCI